MKFIMLVSTIVVASVLFISCSDESDSSPVKPAPTKPAVDAALIGQWAQCSDSVTVSSSYGDTLVATVDSFKILNITLRDYSNSTAYFAENGNIALWVGGTPYYVYDYRIIGNKLIILPEATAEVPVQPTFTTPNILIYQKIQ